MNVYKIITDEHTVILVEADGMRVSEGGDLCFGRKGSNGDTFVLQAKGWRSAGLARPFPANGEIFEGVYDVTKGSIVVGEPIGDKGVDYTDV